MTAFDDFDWPVGKSLLENMSHQIRDKIMFGNDSEKEGGLHETTSTVDKAVIKFIEIYCSEAKSMNHFVICVS